MPIVAVQAEPITGEIQPDLAIISSLGQHLVGQYVLVRLSDDAGRVGLGEASITAVWSGETQAGTLALVREVLAPLVVGPTRSTSSGSAAAWTRRYSATASPRPPWRWPSSTSRGKPSASPCTGCWAA